jgi:mannose-1-phosphate guanylyltransferase
MHVIIMAGGAGTRFWPLSRLHRPKQFLTIIGARPMIEEAFLRIAPLTDERKIYIVVHEDHRQLTEEIFTGKNARIVAEPMSRNTAPCIGLGLIHIMAEHGDGPVVVLPADHYVGDLKAFQRTIRRAVSLVEQGGIATIGIVPTRPETGYGYIKGGDPLSGKGEALQVDAFVEKPSLERAAHFLSKGGYYWNAGIFVFRAQTMMDEIQRCLPELYEGLTYVRKFLGTEDYEQKIRGVYENLTPISIDYGVMEKTTADVFVIPGHFPWSDVGNWRSVFELRGHEQDTEGNIIDGDAIIVNCKNTMVHSRSGRLAGCIGLEDIMVVDTPDALLICHHGCTQDVRRCVEIIKERGLNDLL